MPSLMTNQTTVAVLAEPETPERDPIVPVAIEKMGGCTKAAKRLTERAKAAGDPNAKLGKTAVSGWKRIPDRWVRHVHEETGIPLKKLRKDLFTPTGVEA